MPNLSLRPGFWYVNEFETRLVAVHRRRLRGFILNLFCGGPGFRAALCPLAIGPAIPRAYPGPGFDHSPAGDLIWPHAPARYLCARFIRGAGRQ